MSLRSAEAKQYAETVREGFVCAALFLEFAYEKERSYFVFCRLSFFCCTGLWHNPTYLFLSGSRFQALCVGRTQEDSGGLPLRLKRLGMVIRTSCSVYLSHMMRTQLFSLKAGGQSFTRRR